MFNSFFRLRVLWLICTCTLLVGCGGGDDEEQLSDIPADASSFDKLRAEKDKFFKYDTQSPLPKDIQKAFKGLNYYPYNDTYSVIASFEVSASPDTVKMIASGGETRSMIRLGTYSFTIGEGDAIYTLFGYREAGSTTASVLIPFKDKTTGSETYDAGRYVDIEDTGDAECTINFNKAYSPYCAYNPNYSCLLVPPQNVLTVAIKAGEKNFTKHQTGSK